MEVWFSWPYLERAAQSPDPVQLLVDDGVVAPLIERAPELLLGGWPLLPEGGQAGLLQGLIELLQPVAALLLPVSLPLLPLAL